MICLDDLQMRVGLGQFNELSEERLKFIKQCGCDDFLLNTPRLPGEERWEFRDLLLLRTRAEDAGPRLMALENVPVRFYDRIMLGLPGRDRQLENMQETVRNMGRAGIPILGYHWMPNQVWRTARSPIGRGGAPVTSSDMAAVEGRRGDLLVARTDRSGSDDPFNTTGVIPAAEYHLSEDE